MLSQNTFFTWRIKAMKKLNTLGKVITKILEVFHWVGVALMLAAIICSVAAPNLVGSFVDFDTKECCGANLEVYGFEVNAPVVDGKDKSDFVTGSIFFAAMMINTIAFILK